MATSPRRQGTNPDGFAPGQPTNANSSAGIGGHHLQQTNTGLRLQPSMVVQSDFRKVKKKKKLKKTRKSHPDTIQHGPSAIRRQ